MGRLVTGTLRGAGARVRVFDLPSADFTPFYNDREVEVAAGDITSSSDVASAVEGVGAIVHLAAVLPPLSEKDPALTNRVNVDGTRVLVEEAERAACGAKFVFSSSVSVYGPPASADGIIGGNDPVCPDDAYARSKAESERIVQNSMLDWLALRISGVAVPVFQEPPAVWPFRASQRIEFVHRDDAVRAVASAAAPSAPGRRVYIVSGGESWRMTGARYVEDFYQLVEVDPEEAVYQVDPGHFGWYDSAHSQSILSFQDNTYGDYLTQVRADLNRLLSG